TLVGSSTASSTASSPTRQMPTDNTAGGGDDAFNTFFSET
ncbi:unnamed protein product, partial [Ascophyllum nodosum]